TLTPSVVPSTTLCLSCFAVPLGRHGFPTRRSSDLLLERAVALQPRDQRASWFIGIAQRQRGLAAEAAATWEALLPDVDAATALRSEEHTSELQSRENIVCGPQLEKKRRNTLSARAT